MADGEVKIHVSADADTSAIDDAQRKIDGMQGRAQNATELNPRPSGPQAADTTVKPGGWDALEKRRQDLLAMRREQKDLERQGDAAGAKDLGRRADTLEKNIDKEGARLLRVEAEDGRRSTTDRLRAEREVTRLKKEQTAMERAGVNRAQNIYSAGQQIATGGVAAAPNAMMGMVGGGLKMMIPLMIASAVTGLASVFAREGYKNEEQRLSLATQGASDTIQRERRSSIFGSSESMVTAGVQMEDEIKQRKERRDDLNAKARFKLFDPSTWTFGGVRTNAGQREQIENETRIAQLEEAKEKELAAARKKYIEEEGGLRLRALRGRSQRTQAGQRQAMVAELGADWLSTYKQEKQASGSDELAKEAADLTVQNKLRDRQAQAGAGLVDARSGGAEIAAAAKWAGGALPNAQEVAAEIRTLNATVTQGNQATQMEKQHK